MLLKRFSSASSTIWVIEGLSVEYTVQVLPTAATQKTSKALPVRPSDAVVKPHQEAALIRANANNKKRLVY